MSGFISGCFTWIRTTINGVRVRCPTIRRWSNQFMAALYINTVLLSRGIINIFLFTKTPLPFARFCAKILNVNNKYRKILCQNIDPKPHRPKGTKPRLEGAILLSSTILSQLTRRHGLINYAQMRARPFWRRCNMLTFRTSVKFQPPAAYLMKTMST